jgi:DNA polymerase-1
LLLSLQILNFSIAYGKTAHGLAKDWGTSLEEAEATVARWYADRPEVRDWQARTRAYAARFGWVNTMIGRRRRLPEINSSDRWVSAHGGLCREPWCKYHNYGQLAV